MRYDGIHLPHTLCVEFAEFTHALAVQRKEVGLMIFNFVSGSVVQTLRLALVSAASLLLFQS